MLAAFDGDQAARDKIDIGSAVLGRRVEPMQPHFLGFLDEFFEFLGRDFVGVRVEGVFERDDLLAHKAANHIDNDALLVGQGQVH